MNRRSINAHAFSKHMLVDEPKVPETYSSDRRFVLGVRKPPIQIEKVAKFPDQDNEDKTLTMYAKAGIYSLLVYNNNKLVFHIESQDDPSKATNKDMVCKTPIEAISPAPTGGFLLNFKNVGLVYFTYFASQIEIPLSNDNSWNGCLVSLTSFHWIMPSNKQIIALVGSMFGHVYTLSFTYQATQVPVQELYKDKKQTPVASITSINYCGSLYLLVTTYRNLKIIKWDNPTEDPAEIDTASGPSVCVPSFVVSNDTHVSWLSHDDLRIYTHQQIIDGPQTPSVLGIEELKRLFDVNDTTAFFGTNSKPIIMSKYYTIIVGPSSILGFSVEDCSVQFRYPISSHSPLISLSIDQQKKKIHVATQKRLYDIDLNSEKESVSIRPIKQVREELINEGKTSKDVRAAEVLSSLLEDEQYQKAIDMLQSHLNRVVNKAKAEEKKNPPKPSQELQPGVRRMSEKRSIPRDKVKQLCEEFFIFELSVILASESNNTSSFNLQINVEDEDFDIFAALSKLLQLRAFSSVSGQIYNEKIFATAKDSPLIVRMLLDDNKVQEAIDNILQFGPSSSTESLSSIVFKYRQTLKDLNFYHRVQDNDSQKVCNFVISILPFVAGDIASEDVFYLLHRQLQGKQSKQIDLLLWALSSSDDHLAYKYDEPIYEELVKKNPISNIITNPFTSFQYCLNAKMFRTAALIGTSCGLHEEAVLAANQIEGDNKHCIKHCIKRAPRTMQPHLCKLVGIDLEAEDEGAIRAATKESVIKELDSIESKLDTLQKKFEESEDFLTTIQDWGNDEERTESICAFCKKPLVRTTGFAFPACGHAFHEDCLLNAFMPCCIQNEDKDLLFNYKRTQNTEDKEKAEKKMCEECPICGIVSVNSITAKLEDDEFSWPLDSESIIKLKKK